MTKPLPSSTLLRNLLRYEPNTGRLFWKPRTPEMFDNKRGNAQSSCRRWNTRNAGNEAFTADLQGYKQGRVFNCTYLAHRVIWAMVNGDIRAMKSKP